MSRAATLTKNRRLRSERGYRHPRTGEPRRHHRPLRIDRLSEEVKDAIIEAREQGKTWRETADLASAKAGQQLAVTTVQRWHDLRVHQQGTAAALREIISLLKSILSAVRA